MLGAEPQRPEVTLPPIEEREWLIARTRELLDAFGFRGYVTAPLLEPTPSFFPDRWAGGEASVRRVLLRLLRYADAACSAELGLGELDVVVTLHASDPTRRGEVVNQPPILRGQDSRAWFVKLDAGRARFAVEEDALREPENLVPALARAVAHAVRAAHGLVTTNDVPGHRLIDVAGFALGFGLLTTDASQRFYARSAGGFRSTRAEARLGALSVQDMSLLLAMQAHARGLDKRARRRLLDHLQPNQAGFFDEAMAALAKADRLGTPLRERLGIPSQETWPAAPSLARLTGPLSEPTRARADADEDPDPDEDDAEADEAEEPEERRDLDRGVLGMNRGKPVFRVERSGALRMAKLLGFPVLLLGGLLSQGKFGLDLPMHLVMPSAIGLAVAGLAIGSLFTDRRCSEPKCGRALKPTDEVCPLCGGKVMGVIHSPEERLGAEEELVRQRKVGPDGLLVDRDADDEDEDEDEVEDDGAQRPTTLSSSSSSSVG